MLSVPGDPIHDAEKDGCTWTGGVALGVAPQIVFFRDLLGHHSRQVADVCASEREDQRFLQAYARTQEKDDLRRHAKRHTASPSAAVFLGVMDRVAPEREGIPATALSPPELDAPDRQYLDRVIAHIMQDQLSRQEAYLPFLATTGNISPFIGLLGTVLGIIDSFREIGEARHR